MPEFVPPPFAAARPEPPPRAVESDVPCRKCGYDLRTLGVDGRCPECGQRVRFSVRGHLLRHCDPAWLGTLGRGTVLLRCHVVLLVGTMAAAVVNRLRDRPGDDAATAACLLRSAAYVACLAGAWAVTAADPSGSGERPYGAVRRRVRYALLIGAGAQAAAAAADVGGGTPAAVRLGLDLAADLAAAAVLVALFVYLGRLAARLPDPDAMTWCRSLARGVGVVLALLAVVALPATIPDMGADAGGVAAAVWSAGIACGVAVVGYGQLYFRLSAALGRQFAASADDARRVP